MTLPDEIRLALSKELAAVNEQIDAKTIRLLEYEAYVNGLTGDLDELRRRRDTLLEFLQANPPGDEVTHD